MNSRILLYHNEPINLCSDNDPNSTCLTHGGCATPQLFLQVPPNPTEGQALFYEGGKLVWGTIVVVPAYNDTVGF